MVLNFGEKIAEGEPKRVMQNVEVQRVYMGIEV
jgi:branched-chain amino acid transport system ATP-binding protein